jgi:hypothetical protein
MSATYVLTIQANPSGSTSTTLGFGNSWNTNDSTLGKTPSFIEITDLLLAEIKNIPAQRRKKAYSFIGADFEKIKEALKEEISSMFQKDQRILIEIYRLNLDTQCTSWKRWKGKGSYDATVRSVIGELRKTDPSYEHSRHRYLINELRDKLYQRGLISRN